jgi:hypothetical protein
MTDHTDEPKTAADDSVHPDALVPGAKDVSRYPGNEEGSVQPTTAVKQGSLPREEGGQAHSSREAGQPRP